MHLLVDSGHGIEHLGGRLAAPCVLSRDDEIGLLHVLHDVDDVVLHELQLAPGDNLVRPATPVPAGSVIVRRTLVERAGHEVQIFDGAGPGLIGGLGRLYLVRGLEESRHGGLGDVCDGRHDRRDGLEAGRPHSRHGHVRAGSADAEAADAALVDIGNGGQEVRGPLDVRLLHVGKLLVARRPRALAEVRPVEHERHVPELGEALRVHALSLLLDRQHWAGHHDGRVRLRHVEVVGGIEDACQIEVQLLVLERYLLKVHGLIPFLE